jgi:CubicO group peptidase (beta-lactamase class C family)
MNDLKFNDASCDTAASYEAIDAYIEREMRRLNIPGVSLAIVEGDQIVHLRGFGKARPGGEAPTPQTPFAIGSVTKSFTALAVMQLVEAGKIDLDAPVQHYLPWFGVADPLASAQTPALAPERSAGASVTVRHLLNQTSGFSTSSGEMPLFDFDKTRADVTERQARALSAIALVHPAGSTFEYSNLNYSLLGLIIEVASGESYMDYVQKHIFTPLDMRHTYTLETAAKQDNLAVGHQVWFTLPVAVPKLNIPPGGLAGGGLFSATEDLSRYMIALLNEGRYGDAQILSRAGIDEVQRGAVDISITGLGPIVRFLAKDVSLGQYGMGWYVDKIGQTKLVWHGGTLPHFGAYMALLPEQKKGVALLFNTCHHWYNPLLAEVGTGVTALLAGEQPTRLGFFGLIPWMLRGQLLIPIVQVSGVAATLLLLRRWRQQPERRPSDRRKWWLYILLPLIPDLLTALTLKPLLGKRREYLKLYMPDFSWIAMVCGSFALVWSLLRTGLILRASRTRMIRR